MITKMTCPYPVFFIWKSLLVLQKARIKIVVPVQFTLTYFFLLYTLFSSVAKWKFGAIYIILV